LLICGFGVRVVHLVSSSVKLWSGLALPLGQHFLTGGSRSQSGSRSSGCGVANNSLNSFLKSQIFIAVHINNLYYISKTETWTDFCEIYMSIIIPVWFLLYSFNQPDHRNRPALEKVSAAQWCRDYVSLINISPTVNTCQLKFQQSTADIFIVIVPYYIH